MLCVQLASYLEGGQLMWMMPLHLHVNQKSGYYMMMIILYAQKVFLYSFIIIIDSFVVICIIYHDRIS